MNLATCIWQSRKHGPHHINARLQWVLMKSLERYRLQKLRGEGVTIEPFVGGEVGW